MQLQELKPGDFFTWANGGSIFMLCQRHEDMFEPAYAKYVVVVKASEDYPKTNGTIFAASDFVPVVKVEMELKKCDSE